MSNESPKMSRSTRDLLLRARKMVPPMLEKFHKGKFNVFRDPAHMMANII